MCIDGGVVCVPILITLASAIGLGSIARKVWKKCKG